MTCTIPIQLAHCLTRTHDGFPIIRWHQSAFTSAKLPAPLASVWGGSRELRHEPQLSRRYSCSA